MFAWVSAGSHTRRRKLLRPSRVPRELAKTRLADAGFDPLPDLPARLRSFVDAYGLADRKAILPELHACTLNEPEQLGWLQGIAGDLARAL